MYRWLIICELHTYLTLLDVSCSAITNKKTNLKNKLLISENQKSVGYSLARIQPLDEMLVMIGDLHTLIEKYVCRKMQLYNGKILAG